VAGPQKVTGWSADSHELVKDQICWSMTASAARFTTQLHNRNWALPSIFLHDIIM